MKFFKSAAIRSKLFKTWLISYFLIFVTPLVVGVAIYNMFRDIVLKETMNTNNQILRQVKVTFDHKLEEIDHLMLQIALNNRISQFMYDGPDLNERQRYLIAQIVKELNVYKNSNNFVEDFYVYFKNSGCILSPFGKYNPDEIFDGIDMEENGEFFGLKEDRFNKKCTRQILNGVLKNDSGEKEDVLLYVQSLPLTSQDANSWIIIVVDKAKLSSMFEELKSSQKYLLFLDEKDNVLFTNNKSYKRDVSYIELSTESSMLLKKDDNEKYIFYMQSDVLNLKYVIEIMFGQLAEQAAHIKNIAIISSLLCSVFASVMSFIFSKQNYNPILEIVNIINSRLSPEENSRSDEYNYIKDAILSTFNEREKLKEHLERQKPVIRANFLAKLIKDGVQNNCSFVQDLEFNDIYFYSDYFMVIIVNNESAPNGLNEKKKSEMYFVISDTVREYILQYGTLFDLEVDGEYVYIVNLSAFNDTAAYDFKKVLNEARDKIAVKAGIELSIAYSNVENGAKNIKRAYEKAKSAMEYRFVIGKGNVISAEEIEVISYEYDYSIEDENKLINYIVNGDKDKMKALINEIFDRNLEKRFISIEFGKCLFFNFISTTINIFKNLDIKSGDCFEKGENPVEEMINCSTIQDLKEKISNIYERICDQIAKKRGSRNFLLTELIIEYIDKNYDNADISVSNIAQNLNMNAAYIGNLYKEHTGQNIIDSINKKRIGEAKKLLSYTNDKINKISTKTGFSSSNTFIRTFKKYEGITPKQYKELSLKRHDRENEQ